MLRLNRGLIQLSIYRGILMLKPVIAAACLCAATVVGAQSNEPALSGRQISDLVAGTVVEVDTPAGTKLPVRYAHEGQLTGEARGLAWYLGSASDTGRWWVTAHMLCHRWNRWFNSEPQCLRISKEGRTLHWRSQDGNTGTAMIAVPAVAKASVAMALPLPKLKAAAEASEPTLLATPLPATVAAELDVPALPLIIAELQDLPQPGPVDAAFSPLLLAAKASVGALAFAPPVLGPITKLPNAELPVAEPPAVADTPAPLPPQAEPKPAAQPLFKVANVRSDDVLNVRSGPSSDHDIVGELEPGSRGIAITSACRSRWCPVQLRSVVGWVNSVFLAPEESQLAALQGPADAAPAWRDAPEAPRTCLTPAARALLDRIEQKFGPVRLVSTCRPGATIAGTGRISRHASGNAVDFKAGDRKAVIVEWLIANHRAGGTMTYAGMDHIHVDIGPHFVSLAGGLHWHSWSRNRRAFPATYASDDRR
jgi:uncharacterized protein YcbK (DUF882 family)